MLCNNNNNDNDNNNNNYETKNNPDAYYVFEYYVIYVAGMTIMSQCPNIQRQQK